MISADAEHWGARALCFQKDSDPDMWWDPDYPGKRMARHMCLTHCPVLAQCQKNYEPDGGETAGGICYKNKGIPMTIQPRPASKCWRCARVDTPPRG